MNRSRVVHLMSAHANLRLARYAISEARVALLTAAGEDDDPVWQEDHVLEPLLKEIETAR